MVRKYVVSFMCVLPSKCQQDLNSTRCISKTARLAGDEGRRNVIKENKEKDFACQHDKNKNLYNILNVMDVTS